MSVSCSMQHAILKVAKQLQQLPQGDPATVLSAAQMVDEAAYVEADGTKAQRLKGREAAAASACYVAALQSAGWLLQAVRMLHPPKQHVEEAVFAAADTCLVAGPLWLGQMEMGVDLLRAVVRPSMGGKAPGEDTQVVPMPRGML